MTTISKSVGRGDIILHRGSDERIGVKWEVYDYSSWSPVNLYGWFGTFTMEWFGSTVYSVACVSTSDGIMYADIPAAAFTSDTWKSKANGSWKITATDGSQTEVLAWGNYTIQ